MKKLTKNDIRFLTQKTLNEKWNMTIVNDDVILESFEEIDRQEVERIMKDRLEKNG